MSPTCATCAGSLGHSQFRRRCLLNWVGLTTTYFRGWLITGNERLLGTRDETRPSVSAEVAEHEIRTSADDLLKDPYVFEFLGVAEPGGLHERDLEQGLIDYAEVLTMLAQCQLTHVPIIVEELSGDPLRESVAYLRRLSR